MFETNRFALVLRAFPNLASFAVSPFLLFSTDGELLLLTLRDPGVVELFDDVVGCSAAVVVDDEDDDPTSLAVELRARLCRSRSIRSSLMIDARELKGLLLLQSLFWFDWKTTHQ